LTAQARVGLQLIHNRNEIIKPDDPLELEACATVAGPDHIGFDPAHHWQPDDDAITPLERLRIVDHEAMSRQIADVHVQVAVRKMLDDGRKIDRVPRRAPQIGYTEISSASHATRSFPLSGSFRIDDEERLIIGKGRANLRLG
jgi:hypothetical protein